MTSIREYIEPRGGGFAEEAGFTEEVEFLRLVLEHISDCFVAVNTEGIVVLINRPYCKLLGGTPEDFLGRHITEVVSPHTRLHIVAKTGEPIVGYPLHVRGHELIAKQVPVRLNGRIVGAVGYALFSDSRQLFALARAVSTHEFEMKQGEHRWSPRYNVDDIVGTCPTVEEMRASIAVAARTESPVLIQGETGTGKELAAHAMHALSNRRTAPFVWVNCASIPGELIQADLFGYEGGAFTGARSRGNVGKFELANKGTLFLDEIGDMPLSMQASLLRILEEGEIVRIGGTHPLKVDVRFICATHRNLEELVASGWFRADLLYRLDVHRIRTPPLRERCDIDEVALHLLQKICMRHARGQMRMADEVLETLRSYQWPGNVRELRNVLERAVHMVPDGADSIAVLPPLGAQSIAAREGMKNHRQAAKPQSLASAVQAAERAALEEALVQSDGNKSQTARLLRIDRSYLYKKLAQHNLV